MHRFRSIFDPHPSQLGFAFGKHRGAPFGLLGCKPHSPFLVLRTEGGRKLADAEGRAAECGARALTERNH
jgi:hypothetical protein